MSVHSLNWDCVFQWSPFQLSGHRPHHRADRPVVWSHTPRRYSTKNHLSGLLTWLIVTFSHILSSPSSLQCRRAVVPSQLSRTVVFLSAGLVEWSSKIRGENVWIDRPVKDELSGCLLPSPGDSVQTVKLCLFGFMSSVLSGKTASLRSENILTFSFLHQSAKTWQKGKYCWELMTL